MKFLATVLVLAFVSLNTFASGKTPPGSDGYGTPQCRAYDAGSTEEHAPHPSCDSCLAAHGNCNMRCFSYDYTCTSTLHKQEAHVIIDPKTKQPREELRDVAIPYTSVAQTIDIARQQALQQCQWSNGFGANCSYATCNENSHQTSSQACVRH
jgi:hypothetical protein